MRFALYRFLHEHNQFFDVMRRRLTFIDDEIGVHGGNLRAAYTPAFQAARLDQAGCVVAWRIAEYRARVGLGERLRGDPLRQQLLNPLAGLVAVTPRKTEPGGNEKLIASLHRKDAAITDGILVRLANLQPAGAVYGAHSGNRIPGLGSIAAGIHCQCATHGAGNAGEKLRAIEVMNCREACDFRTGDAGFRINLGVTGTFLQKEARKNAMRKHHSCAKTSIPDQQIAAKPDEENRFMFRYPAEEYPEIVKICRRVSTIGDTARSPADMLAHRLVALEFATQSAGLDLSKFCHIHASWLSFLLLFFPVPFRWTRPPW